MSSRLVPYETFYDRYRRAHFTTWEIDILGRKETLQAGDFNEIRAPEIDESMVLAELISQFQQKFSGSSTIVISSGNCYFPNFIDSSRVRVIVASSLQHIVESLATMADGAEDTPALSHHQRSQGANSSHRGGLEERPRLLVLFYRLNCVIGIHKVSKVFQELVPSLSRASSALVVSGGRSNLSDQPSDSAPSTAASSPSASSESSARRRAVGGRKRAVVSAAEALAAARDVVRRFMAYSAWISVGVFPRGSESVCSAAGKGQALIDRTLQL